MKSLWELVEDGRDQLQAAARTKQQSDTVMLADGLTMKGEQLADVGSIAPWYPSFKLRLDRAYPAMGEVVAVRDEKYLIQEGSVVLYVQGQQHRTISYTPPPVLREATQEELDAIALEDIKACEPGNLWKSIDVKTQSPQRIEELKRSHFYFNHPDRNYCVDTFNSNTLEIPKGTSYRLEGAMEFMPWILTQEFSWQEKWIREGIRREGIRKVMLIPLD